MTTFEEWWDMAYGTSIVPEEARLAWEAATLAERKRCAGLCLSISKQFDKMASEFDPPSKNILQISDGAYKCYVNIRES